MKKISYTKNPAPANRMFSSEKPLEQLFCSSERNSLKCLLLFCSMERNYELFSLTWNGSEQNSQSLLLFLFHGTKFRAFFSSAERLGRECLEFYVPSNGRNSAGTNQ
jgi:hypothetical protein